MQEDKVRLQTLLCLEKILYHNRNLEDIFDSSFADFSPRDKSFARMLLATVLKRKGQIDAVLKSLLKKPLPFKARFIYDILMIGTAQILFMNVPSHAAVSTSVDLAKTVENGFYTKLVNAVLRNLLKKKPTLPPVTTNIPSWIYANWAARHGEETTFQIANSFLKEPAIDIVVKDNPTYWAEKLNATVIRGNCLRLPNGCFIPTLDGFDEGAWWVQDNGAYLAVEVLGDVRELFVADLCAAPGGKTAALLSKGAKVDAFDISPNRIKRLKENLTRLHLKTDVFVQNAKEIAGENKYDIVLLDAPCSATGTLRRHPDVLLHRKPQDIVALTHTQEELLKTAHRLVKKGGKVVYCTCSLQKEEGEDQIQKLSSLFRIIPIENFPKNKTPEGFLRTMPFQNSDGFFIALLEKK